MDSNMPTTIAAGEDRIVAAGEASAAPLVSKKQPRTASPAPRADPDAGQKRSSYTSEPLPEEEQQPVDPDAGQTAAGKVADIGFVIIVLLVGCAGGIFCFPGLAELHDHWSSINGPLSKILVENVDSIVVMTALMVLSPLLWIVAVTIFRAAADLRQLNKWQGVSLSTLVAFAVYVSTAPAQAVSWWKSVKDPLTDLLVDHSDNIVSVTALLTFVPLLLILVVCAVRLLWACRLQLIVYTPAPGVEGEQGEGLNGSS